MTVNQLRREMSVSEFARWQVFFKRRDNAQKRQRENQEDLDTARKAAAGMRRA